MTLRDDLQTTLGAAYTLERELGGGGMSRVFVAEERSLGRRVVVKVLPPEIAAGVNVDRFKREIQMAARLQYPHIVPVLLAGEMNGLPFYTMPFVEGESLRARLQRDGALAITETIGVLRDVAKALAYAHERGIVHRDIKPDNVLLSEGAATVADFGIAKAIAAARAGEGSKGLETLTQMGTSLGTPAYMAPEQAAADPATDHRADIYSFGCMAYELLTGRPPFVAKSPQKLLAAQMGETPAPVATLRPDTPPALAELVMRCLAKDADQRPQHARALVEVLDTVTSSGSIGAMPPILLGGAPAAKRALLAYAAAFVAVAILARAAIVAIGLPDWVFPGALIVMALGLPVMLFTAYVHHTTRRAVTVTPTYTPGGSSSTGAAGTMATLAMKASPHVTWRRAWMGGALAFAGFVALVATYMVLRSMGIGPFGSLMAAGALQRDERLLVTDFSSPASDSTLGPVISDAFRTAMGQSRTITVMQPNQVGDVLRRMQRPANTRVDFNVGREIATREGIRGVVDGDIISLGGSFAISVRLVSPTTGDVLASFRETADSDRELLRAVDKLAKDLRSRIGESLKNVQSTRAFEQVTTPSLEALRKYVQGSLALSLDGDFPKGSALLEQAIALDSGFAMAYRKLAVEYSNRGQTDRAMELLQKAYDNRDRLTDVERYYMLGSYYQLGPRQDLNKAIENYEAALELAPDLVGAMNNAANSYRFQRNWPKAADLYERAIKSGSPPAVAYGNLVATYLNMGRSTDAWRTLAAFDSAYPLNASRFVARANLYFHEGRYDSVAAVNERLYRDRPNDLVARTNAATGMFIVARLQGRLRDAASRRSEQADIERQRGIAQAQLTRDVNQAFARAFYLDDRAGAAALLDRALATTPLERLPVASRPFNQVVLVHAMAGQVDKAKRARDLFDESHRNVVQTGDELVRRQMDGAIAIAERRYGDAVAAYRAADQGACITCVLPQLAMAYDLNGQGDSVIAVLERFISTPDYSKAGAAASFLPWSHKRLGELYDARGDRENALSHYLRFVELWKNADPELQPKVAEARARIARLRDRER